MLLPNIRLFLSYRCLSHSVSIAVTLLALCGTAVADRLMPDTVNQVETGNRAVNSLILRARQYLRNGAHDSAAGELERAIRIAPRTALAWHELARVRFVQGNHNDAESLASKAAVLIGGTDPDLKLANDRLAKLSQRAQGKHVGNQQPASQTSSDSQRAVRSVYQTHTEQQPVAVNQTQPAYRIQSIRTASPAPAPTPSPAPATQPSVRPAPTQETSTPSAPQVAIKRHEPVRSQPRPATQSSATRLSESPATTRQQTPKVPQTFVGATPEETAISPARPLGSQSSDARVRVGPAANDRLARRAPPPVTRTYKRDPSQPARVVDRSAPLVQTSRLIKRRPEKTRMTILLFQAKRGAPVVEKSLIYQHRKPSPVAIN